MQNVMDMLDLGRKNYKEAWDIQKMLHEKRVHNEIADTLILVEHNPVVTLGKSGNRDNIKIPIQLLKEKGIDFFQIERGGDVTFHGPGQVVGYPICNIKQGLAGIKPFIDKLEDVIIETLYDFDICAKKREKMIGVWVQEKKICSIGIAVKRWVSFHGFALNVNIDLQYFDLIYPCGFKDIKMTSMQEILRRQIPMEAVKKGIIENFIKIFQKNCVV
ncbi:MAG: lipoyl(octanoyl) transferase LipB [bacterium]